MRRSSALREWLLPLLVLTGEPAWARPPLQQPLGGSEDNRVNNDAVGAKSGFGSQGGVASESSICSQIGVDLLAQGGNAADAMVGTTICVGVIGMYHSGIGGGGFMLIRTPDGRYETVDYRETAPASAYEDMYAGNTVGSVIGGLAVSVPGELRGLAYLHGRYGALPWKTVLTPAVHVARDGFPVSEDLVRYMDSATDYVKDYVGDFLVQDPNWAEDFAPNRTRLVLGDTITRKRYANTLEQIAEHGVDIFYHGKMAKSMVDEINKNNGSISLHDYAKYRVVVRPAVSTKYGGKLLFATGAPSSGSVALAILNTMDKFAKDGSNADVNLTTHRFDEAMRFGYGARTHFGDPAFVDGVDTLESDLLSTDWAVDVRHKILDNATLPVKDYNPEGTYAQPGHGTSHVVTADRSGFAVSSTTTINTLFGSLVLDPETGVILNNQMNDFSIPHSDNEFGYPPSPANFIRPGKRPLSSMSPLMAEDEERNLILVTGAAGGSRIISASAQVAWHVLEHNMTMAEALKAPRLHDQLAPNTVQFEYGFDKATVASMEDKGHDVAWVRLGVSAAQGIRIVDGQFEAVGEPRQINSGGSVL